MPVPIATTRRYAFGDYEADLNSGELSKNGKRVRLQSQPFQMLVMLLERPGQLITREEICQKLWSSDTFVDFDHSLGTALNKVREVLNDSAVAPRFVETLPRRGYRFIAPVTEIAEPVAVAEEKESSASKTGEEHRRNRFLYWIVGICVSAAFVIFLFAAWHFQGQQSVSLLQANANTKVSSIAVLPLINLSNDPDQQFFADGVTDELITSLAQISSLRVISRTSTMAYVGTRKPAAQIARELGVDALVEGSVVRSANRVRITAQLIQAASDRHLWARSYDRELSDVLTAQGQIAREIAESISVRLTPQEQIRLARNSPVNPKVALLYFKGSYFLGQLDTAHAKEIFTEAIHLDPNNAESWAGLADTLHTMGVEGDDNTAFSQAKDAANKALEIDPSQAQALMVLGMVSFLYDWNPTQSEAFFRRSIALRPSYAMAHALFANMLAHHGKIDEAIEETTLASASEPGSVLTNSMAWHTYFCARRYDDALRIMLSAAEVDPSVGPANFRLAITWERKGEYLKAIESNSEEDARSLRVAFNSGGEQGYWQRKLDILLRGRPPNSRRRFSEIARCYMHLGEREEALRTLEKGYKMHDPFLIFWLPIHEEFDPLRSEPRFQTMLRGLGVS